MPLKINVPFEEKDEAKSRGAFWDKEEKTWFVPDHRNINDFTQWIDNSAFSIIAKSPFYIVLNNRACWKCNNETSVIALAFDHLYLAEEDETGEVVWLGSEDQFSFFSTVTFINNDARAIIERVFPFYKLGYSKTAEGRYWANHCEHCNALQGDFHLHSEPGEAFFPIEIDDCRKITLLNVTTRFDLEIEAEITWSSNQDNILNYSKKMSLD